MLAHVDAYLCLCGCVCVCTSVYGSAVGSLACDKIYLKIFLENDLPKVIFIASGCVLIIVLCLFCMFRVYYRERVGW